MVSRHTGIRMPEKTDKQIKELISWKVASNLTDAIVISVDYRHTEERKYRQLEAENEVLRGKILKLKELIEAQK